MNENSKYYDKTLSHYHFVKHKSHADRPENEASPQRWETDESRPELRHDPWFGIWNQTGVRLEYHENFTVQVFIFLICLKPEFGQETLSVFMKRED
jgi:hypothetical protein